MGKKSKKARIENLLTAQSIPYVRISDDEREQAQDTWRKVYARPVFEKFGEWTVDGFDWHGFCRGLTPCLSFNDAWSAYRRLEPQMFIILPNLDDGSAYSCGGRKYPDFSNKGHDAYVCATNMDWTMVFDHEGLGPYFSTRRLVDEGAL